MTTPLTLPKGMESMKVQVIDGVPHAAYALDTGDMVLQHALIRDLEMREDDVIIVGIPKMGNHWLFEVTGMIMKQTVDYEKDQFISHLLDYIGVDIAARVAKIKPPRVFAMHSFIEKLPKQALEKKVKILFPLRNPKDVWVSAYHMYSSFDHPPLHFSGTWDDFYNARMRGEFLFDTWFKNVKSVERFMEQNPEMPVYVNSFERMKLDSKGAIRDLCNFLGKPTDLVDEIAEATSFETMKKNLDGSKMGDFKNKYMDKKKAGVMRKGEIRDWKNTFTVAQNEAFDALFEKEMAGSKLGDMQEVAGWIKRLEISWLET